MEEEGTMNIAAETSSAPKSPAKRRKSLGKMSKDGEGSSTPTKSPSKRSKSPGKMKSTSKSPGKLRKSSLGRNLSGDPLGLNDGENKEEKEGDDSTRRKRSKSPGKMKSSRSKSPGKHKSKSTSKHNRPSWWELGLDDDERAAQEQRLQMEEAEVQRQQDELSKFKDRHEQEKQKSVKRGLVAQRLLEAAQPKERQAKPIVLKSVKADPLKLDLSKFEAPSYKKTNDQKDLLKETTKKNFILKDLAAGAKTDIRRLVKAFEPVEVKHGKKIVRQGNEGKHMYVVERGTVEFQVDNVTVGTASAGMTFGDRNLLFQGKENATVIASSEGKKSTKLLRLNQETYRGIMQTTEKAKAEQEKEVKPPPEKDAWLNKSKILQEKEAIQKALRDHVGPDDLERIKVLGEGQFGEVWLVATKLPGVAVPDGKDKHEFALKCQSIAGDMEKAIRGEIDVMGKLLHPFIATLYHTYESEDSLDMLLGLIPGGELWDVVHKENEETGEWLSGISESHAQFYSLVVADTLAFMHSQQFIFRDLKPENIMIDEKGYPIIVDFGFAKKCPTETYTFCGTPNYVSPEIIKNAGHGPGADWWALGIVIYEMIAGENPFYYDGMEQMALYQAICEEDGEPLKDVFSKGVRDLVERLLTKDPAKRLGSRTGQDVLDHSFFSGLNLSKIRAKKIRAPWIPGGGDGDGGVDEEAEAERQREVEEELERLQQEEEDRRRRRDEERRQKQREEEAERLRLEKEADRQRLKEEEERRRLEEERLRKQRELEEFEREKHEEAEALRLKQEEEERQRKLELERKQEEKQKEIKRHQEEEKRQKQLDLKRQKEEEELQLQKKREEELRLKQEEEEGQRKLELDRKRKEEERQLELKRKQEEEEERERQLELKRQQKEEELQLQKKREEELRLKKEEEERQRKLELERERKEEERQLEIKREQEEEEERERKLELERRKEEGRQLELQRQREEEERERQLEVEQQELEEERQRLQEEERQKEILVEREREEKKKREEQKKQKREERKHQRAGKERVKAEEELKQVEPQKQAEESTGKPQATDEDQEFSLEQLLEEDEAVKNRNTDMEKRWGSLVSPTGQKKKNARDLVSPVPKGYAKKVAGQWGRENSPGSLVSPRVQEELSKSVKKGLVASRLSSARQKEMGSSVPSLFTNFQL